MKAMPFKTDAVFGFETMKVSVEDPDTRIDEGENRLMIDGGLITVSVSLAVLEEVTGVDPMLYVKRSVEFDHVPAATPLTSTVIVQVAPAVTDPPAKAKTDAPEARPVKDPVPQLEREKLGGVATTIPAGSESLKATFVRFTLPAEVFAMENVSVDVSPFLTGSGLNDLPNNGSGSASWQPVKVMSSR